MSKTCACQNVHGKFAVYATNLPALHGKCRMQTDRMQRTIGQLHHEHDSEACLCHHVINLNDMRMLCSLVPVSRRERRGKLVLTHARHSFDRHSGCASCGGAVCENHLRRHSQDQYYLREYSGSLVCMQSDEGNSLWQAMFILERGMCVGIARRSAGRSVRCKHRWDWALARPSRAASLSQR